MLLECLLPRRDAAGAVPSVHYHPALLPVPHVLLPVLLPVPLLLAQVARLLLAALPVLAALVALAPQRSLLELQPASGAASCSPAAHRRHLLLLGWPRQCHLLQLQLALP